MGSGVEPHVEAEPDSGHLPRASLCLWHSGNGEHPRGGLRVALAPKGTRRAMGCANRPCHLPERAL